MDSLLTFFESITLLLVVKWLMVVLLVVYTIFAYLMMRQTKAMTKAITMKDDYVIRMAGVIHLAAAVLVLVLAILIL